MNDDIDLVLTEYSRLETRVTIEADGAGPVRLVPSASITGFVAKAAPAGEVAFDVVWIGMAQCEDDEQVFLGSLDLVAAGVIVAARRVRITVPARPCVGGLVDLLIL